jgi:hypothetical protein
MCSGTFVQGFQTCQPNGTFTDCTCDADLERIRRLMVGEWSGMETTPFNLPFPVRITFGADGHYSAHCDEQTACPAPVFHYGVDNDDPSKTYQVTDLRADDTGSGHIVIFWAPGNTETGEIDEVSVNSYSGSDHLSFRFWASWVNTGPFQFVLDRITH